MSKAQSDDGRSAAALGLAIYALITISVVLAGVDEHDPFEIALYLTGQAIALMVAHGYAESVAHRVSFWSGILHSFPVLAVATPSVAVAIVVGLIGLDGENVVYLAEPLNLAGLLLLQALATRRSGFTWSRLAGALLLDAIVVITVLLFVALLK